jgi:uncharacterized protein (UPF0264 family)
MGELVEHAPCFAGSGLRYLKWGLAGCRGRAGWPEELAEVIARMQCANPGCQAVAIAYADWCRANAPPPDVVCAVAGTHRCAAVLFDTWRKDGTTLLDWLSPSAVHALCQTCRQLGMRIALAGSLRAEQIKLLRLAEPDWFAVRGAVCKDGRREQPIDAMAVRRLAGLTRDPPAIREN